MCLCVYVWVRANMQLCLSVSMQVDVPSVCGWAYKCAVVLDCVSANWCSLLGVHASVCVGPWDEAVNKDGAQRLDHIFLD